MLKEADTYVGALPLLDWLYIGRLPMEIVTHEETEKRYARVQSHNRTGNCQDQVIARVFDDQE